MYLPRILAGGAESLDVLRLTLDGDLSRSWDLAAFRETLHPETPKPLN